MPPKAAKLLWDIRDAAAFVLDATTDAPFDDYLADRMLRQAVERNFEIMGEAMRRLSDLDPEVAESITGRGRIIAFRNRLIHGYDAVNQAAVWDIIQNFLPVLHAEVEALLPNPDDA